MARILKDKMKQEGEKYRVLLDGGPDDSGEGRDFFGKDLSKKYGLSSSLPRKL